MKNALTQMDAGVHTTTINVAGNSVGIAFRGSEDESQKIWQPFKKKKSKFAGCVLCVLVNTSLTH